MKSVNIVDYTGCSFEDVKQSIEAFDDTILVTKSAKPFKNRNNIIVTEMPSFYEEKKLNDPYSQAKKADPYCQVVTTKNIKDGIMRVVLKELLVKQDIKQGRFSFAKEKAGVIRYVYTPLYDEKGDINSYMVMEMEKERFVFREYGLFDRDLALIESLFLKSDSLKEVEAVIEDDKGNLNVIFKTNKYPIADSKFILDYYRNHDENKDRRWDPRRKEFRAYTAGLYDIVHYKDGDSFFYHVGYNRNDRLDSANLKTSPFREVKAVKGDVVIEPVLDSLDEYMVRNKEVTVLPFYMKYVREYVNIASSDVK